MFMRGHVTKCQYIYVTNLIGFQKMSDSEELVNMWDMLPDKIDEWDPFRYDNIVQTGAELC